mgnify:CR=1 FL=1
MLLADDDAARLRLMDRWVLPAGARPWPDRREAADRRRDVALALTALAERRRADADAALVALRHPSLPGDDRA